MGDGKRRYDEAEVDVSCCHGCAAKIRFLSNGLFCLIGSPEIKGTESGPGARGLRAWGPRA